MTCGEQTLMGEAIQDNRWPSAGAPRVICFEPAIRHRGVSWLRLRFAPDIPVGKSRTGMAGALVARRCGAAFGAGRGERSHRRRSSSRTSPRPDAEDDPGEPSPRPAPGEASRCPPRRTRRPSIREEVSRGEWLALQTRFASETVPWVYSFSWKHTREGRRRAAPRVFFVEHSNYLRR